jgi:hypothetical protein
MKLNPDEGDQVIVEESPLTQHRHVRRKPMVGHLHWRVLKWECRAIGGANVSLIGAETSVWVNDVGSDTFEQRGLLTFLPGKDIFDIAIPVTKDGPIQIYQQQRIAGGRWADPTTPLAIDVKVDYPGAPIQPRLRVLDNDGQQALVEAEVNWSDYTERGAPLKPDGGRLMILPPCGDSDNDWEKAFELHYAANEERPEAPIIQQFTVPVLSGVATWTARWQVSNLCDLWSLPSPPETFNVNSTELESSGVGGFSTHCPHE